MRGMILKKSARQAAMTQIRALYHDAALAILKTLSIPPSNWYVCLVTDRVERVGNTVRRPLEYWSPAVHDLLRYLESVDFPAPRVLRSEDGIETPTWIDGEAGSDGWARVVPESGLRRWAQFLRSYHNAVA